MELGGGVRARLAAQERVQPAAEPARHVQDQRRVAHALIVRQRPAVVQHAAVGAREVRARRRHAACVAPLPSSLRPPSAP
eukprot:6172135-Pleurochrysis_carterae.AAC.3